VGSGTVFPKNITPRGFEGIIKEKKGSPKKSRSGWIPRHPWETRRRRTGSTGPIKNEAFTRPPKETELTQERGVGKICPGRGNAAGEKTVVVNLHDNGKRGKDQRKRARQV